MMKPYYETENGKLYYGDCFEIMPELEQVDFILIDPPYGLSFMGKKWDYDVPSIETFKIMLNAVKPGATMFCFAGSRTQHRMAVNIEDAGWILKDCIMWLYGSGFPKATDISKQIDKMAGKERTQKYNIKNDLFGKNKMPIWTSQKQGKKSMFDGGKERPATYPATYPAKFWNGWKSHGLKPAYEPILVCMKPNEGSYTENALKHDVAGLNIDGGRIEINENIERRYDLKNAGSKPIKLTKNYNPTISFGKNKQKERTKTSSHFDKGRYPANIILDEEAAKLLDKQSGINKSNSSDYNWDDSKQGNVPVINNIKSGIHFADKGSASRFFYCAKASKSERNAGLSSNKQKRDQSRSHGQAGTDNPYNRGAQEVTNHHPTVKPLALLKYLLTLLKTPTGGICLDCFAGSGSTLVACENIGIKYIGIEKELEYCKIAKQRIENERKQRKMF